MRYDDASQAGSMASDSAPIARPDVDALPPGSFGPATGNAITGAGTTTGSSGEDIVGDAPGHIVAVQGAGGGTTGGAGNFQATGQYGILNMDAEGNFNYVRNAGTPDGVQDVFNYTLADADGQTSATTLTIDIGKGGTGQAAVVPGTAPVIPGVVNLPAGVQLSDIHVNGRDLIINMPDGSQMVIPGGAVFVPQLVIGDVQVPPSNLAALLVESEPQPAAGPLQSSGGNFATDVPPLDPGVPLGDLIPPTELVFPPPTIIEVGQDVDREPTAGAISAQLDDDALANGIAGGIGDDPDSVNASGLLPGSGGDAPIHWDLLNTGAPAGFSYVDGPNGSILVQQVQNGSTVTVLTITIDPSTGAYTITENHPIMHPAGGDENNVSFVINYTVTDVDGDVAPGTLTINVDDDTPVVSNVQTGPGVVLDETTAGSPAGFPISGTSASPAISASLAFGADGPAVTGSTVYALSLNGGGSTLASGLATAIGDHPITLNLTSSTLITATYTDGSGTHTAFTVQLNANGTVTVTQFVPLEHLVDGSTAAAYDDTLSLAGLVNATVTITDKDGDTATGSAPIGGSIIFHDDGPSISLADRGEPNLVVDETDLNTNASASFAANFSANFGADGAGTVTYALGISSSGANSGLVDSATGQAIVLVMNGGVVEGHVGTAGGALAFTVSVDSSGTVTLDQIRAVMQPDGTSPDTDETVTLAADNLVTLTATVTDSDGDFATRSIDIGTNLIFHDDGPSATQAQLTGTVDEDGVPGGIAGGTGDVAGEITVATGNVSALFSSGADAPLTFGLLSDTSGLPALTSGGLTVHYSVSGNTLTAYTGANPSLGQVFTFTVNADGSYTFTLLDQLDHSAGNNENDLSIALGSIIEATDRDGDFVAANANGLVITVDDDTPTASNNQVTGTVDEDGVPGGIAGGIGDVAGEATVATGSVSTLFNSGADAPLSYGLLADTSGLPALTSGGLTVHYSVSGNTLTAYTGANPSLGQVFTFTLNANGTWTFTLLDQLDHAPGNNENDLSIALGSIIGATDADGDSVTANANGLVITVDDDTPTNNDSVQTLQVDEDALGGGNPGGPNDGPGTLATANGSISGLFNSGADQPLTLGMSTNTSGLPALTSNGVAVTYQVVGNTLTASAGGNTVFTLVLNPATGNVTFTLVDQLDHPTLNGQVGDNTENNLIIDFSSIFQGTDADGDSVSLDAGSFLVDVDDDTPIATASQVTGVVDEDGVPGGIANGPGDVAGTATVATGSVSTLFSAGADAPLTYGLSASTGGLPALTSGGLQVTYAVVGNTLTASAGGNTVFTFTLNANGTWTFTLVDQIDHPTLNGQVGDDTENDLAIDLSSIVQATDADGDTVTANANGIVITVDDDTPVAVNDTDTVGAPGSTATGNVITDAAPGDAGDSDTGADSVGADQPGSIIGLASVGNPGATDTDPSPSFFSIAGQYGTLVMDSSGNYTYTRNAGTPGGVTDVFTYTLQDADGDKTTATLTITLADSVPVATTASAKVDDDGLSGGNPGGTGDDNQNTGESPITNSEATWSGLLGGSGGDAPVQFLFSTSLNGTTASVGQETVTYSVSGAGPAGFGTVLTATVTGGARNGTVLFTVTITDTATGAYTVQLLDNVLHPTLNGVAGDNTENNVSVIVNYQMRDNDGDTSAAPGQLTIDFDDDTPVTTATLLTGTVDEDGVTGGIAGGVGDVAGESTVATGDVSSLFSAGADAPLTFGLLTNTSGLPALTSNGVTVTYQVVGNTLTASAGGNTVFTFVLNANGTYTFTLVDQLDHAAGNNENDLTIALGSIIQATDADGDSVTAAANGLVITVDDDTPTTTASQVTGTVDEDGLTGGIAGGSGDVAGEATTATGSVTTLFNSGADAPLTFGLSTVTSGLPALTSGGVSVTYSVVGNVLTASAGGNTVFTLTMNANGTWTFNLVRPLDHATGNGENDLTIDLSSVVKATDADGDSITAAANGLVITIDDDSPINFTPQDMTDDTGATLTLEDDSIINNGNGLETNPLHDTNNDGVGENFIGADGFAATNGLVFTATGHTDGEQLTDASSNPLTSGGNPIYVYGWGTGTLTATTDANALDGLDPSLTVFTMTLNQGAGYGSNSTYTIDFNQTIDNGGGISFDNLTSTAAGNVPYRAVGAGDPSQPVDLLLSAGPNPATTINTDSDSIGAANQSMDVGETVRIDFVTNINDDPTDNTASFPTGFTFGAHVSSNSFLGLIPQVQGAQTETTAFTVWALDSTFTQSGAPDRDPTGGFSDATITTITEVTVQDYLTGNTTTVDVTGFTVGVFTAVAYGISVRVNSDGSVTFSGIQEGDHYGFSTGSGDFNAVVVQSNAAGTGGSTEDSFDLGVFSIGVTSLGDPIDLSFGVTATDRDGDTSTGTIDITLSPDTSSAQTLLSTKQSVSDTLQVTTNSNPVLMGALAAAGLAASEPLAAHGIDLPSSAAHGLEAAALHTTALTPIAADALAGAHGLELAAIASDGGSEAQQASASFHSDAAGAEGKLDSAASNAADHASAALPQGTDAPVNDAGHAPAAFTAAGIGMPDAALLLAASQAGGVAGQAPSVEGQHNEVVAKVLVDALNGGGHGPDVQALVEALPGNGNHGQAAADALASHAAAAVPNGDMGDFGAFAAGLGMHMFAMHQDAVPAHG